MPNFGGIAYKSNAKARTGGASPYDSTTVQKPEKHTYGAFNPAGPTENITAASTKGGNIKGNKNPRTANRASSY
jgi:hypothetical protein|tara:strand:+ start:304 stop:525 length:222 start_codon:yes stop_codon:yes gene_type:complete